MKSADSLLRHMRRRFDKARAKDQSGYFGLSEIACSPDPLEKDRVRGLLIKLVARGQVEARVFSNGVFWRAA